MCKVWPHQLFFYCYYYLTFFNFLQNFIKFLRLSVRLSKAGGKFVEQVMSMDKYPSNFLPQMETIVFIILQIFSTTRAI